MCYGCCEYERTYSGTCELYPSPCSERFLPDYSAVPLADDCPDWTPPREANARRLELES